MTKNILTPAVLLATGFEMAAYRTAVQNLVSYDGELAESDRIMIEEHDIALQLYCMTFVPTAQ